MLVDYYLAKIGFFKAMALVNKNLEETIDVLNQV